MGCYNDGVLEGGSGGCVAYNTGATFVGVTAITDTIKTRVINYTSAVSSENPAGMLNLVTGIATIPYAGNWTFTSTMEMTISAAGVVFHGIELNLGGGGWFGWSISENWPGAAGFVNLACSVTKYFDAGDQVAAFVQQYTGFAATLNGNNKRVNLLGTASCIP